MFVKMKTLVAVAAGILLSLPALSEAQVRINVGTGGYRGGPYYGGGGYGRGYYGPAVGGSGFSIGIGTGYSPYRSGYYNNSSYYRNGYNNGVIYQNSPYISNRQPNRVYTPRNRYDSRFYGYR